MQIETCNKKCKTSKEKRNVRQRGNEAEITNMHDWRRPNKSFAWRARMPARITQGQLHYTKTCSTRKHRKKNKTGKHSLEVGNEKQAIQNDEVRLLSTGTY